MTGKELDRVLEAVQNTVLEIGKDLDVDPLVMAGVLLETAGRIQAASAIVARLGDPGDKP